MTKPKDKSITYFGQIFGLSKTEWNNLRTEWRVKVKDSGFKDIEQYSEEYKSNQIVFLDDVMRDMRPKVERGSGTIPEFSAERETFYRALGIAVYHTDLVPERFKEAALMLSEGKSYPKIIEALKGTTAVYVFKEMFSSKKFQKKIIDAVREFDERCLDD